AAFVGQVDELAAGGVTGRGQGHGAGSGLDFCPRHGERSDPKKASHCGPRSVEHRQVGPWPVMAVENTGPFHGATIALL
ncbi:MAG: hypothetical protein CRU78_14630, partial [Candidatus Accumulibacter phosphatis]|nr:hypothetical protein [Candidatus Accumulibacter phosphatis]